MPSFAADFFRRFQSSSLADLSSASAELNNDEWQMLLPAVAELYSQSLDFLIKQSLPVSRDYYYWDQRLNRGYLSVVYYGVQSLSIVYPLKSIWPTSLADFSTKPWRQLPVLAFQFTRQQMKMKRNNLRAYQRLQASTIGLCVQQGLASTLRISAMGEKQSSSIEQQAVISQTLLIVYNSLQLLRDVEHLPQQNNTSAIRNNENSSLHRVDSAAALDMMQTLSTEATSRQLSLQEAKEIMADIRCLIEDRQFDPAAAVIQENGRPSALVENWVPAIGGAVLAYQTARNWFKYRGRLFQSLTQLSDIIRQVFTDWVVEPMWKIWKTIRHEEQLNLISGGAHSVINDLNSLERMAVDYARDNQLLSTMELQELPIKVREGDLSLIMHAYEYNMRSPVKNMVGGDMLRLILIQVQKAKVDLGTAMQALDKLLRANQLNFAFLAVLPTLFLLGGAWGALSRLIKRRRGLGRGKLHRRLFRSLREIEKLLLLDEPTTTNLYTSLGRLLIETYLLHQMASVHLPTADGLREMFTEDLSAIESLQLRTSQKLAILQRMKQTLDIYLRQ